MTLNSCDSLGHALSLITPSIDNVRQQIAKMRAVNKQPRALKVSPLNWAILSGEIAQLAPFYPSGKNMFTVLGLKIEFTPEPKLEVVE